MKLNAAMLAAMGRQFDFRSSLAVTFRGDMAGIRALSMLRSMDGVAFENDMLTLAILGSSDWDSDRNRTQVVYFPIDFYWNDRHFMEAVNRGIENINVAAKSPLQRMMSSREKMRYQVEADVIDGALPMDLRRDIIDFGYDVVASVVDDDGLPIVRVEISESDTVCVTIDLCCWSGVIKVDGRYVAFCGTLQTAEAEIRKAFEAYLEKVTA